jgi:hypothetical protein
MDWIDELIKYEKAKNEGKNKNQILKELILNHISSNTTDFNQINKNST